MSGKATPVQMSAYLTALALKGETIDEITASAAGMRAHCIKLLHNMEKKRTNIREYKQNPIGFGKVEIKWRQRHKRKM